MDNYVQCLEDLSQYISYDVILCDIDGSKNQSHRSNLDAMYAHILDCIFLTSEYLPVKAGSHENRVVGWNLYCRALYEIARDKYLIWHIGGRVRIGQDFMEMKTSRAAFENALNFCRKHERNTRKFIIKISSCKQKSVLERSG